jgi:tetratricopeptide (TPR) repeat protein
LDDAWVELQALKAAHHEASFNAELVELEADCHLARFEASSVGFADRRELERAVELYQLLVTSTANINWAHYQLGRARMLSMDYLSAVQEFQQALVLTGRNDIPEMTAYCYERLGYIEYYENRNPSSALSYLQRALDTYPADSDQLWQVSVYLLCGRILSEFYDLASALAATQIAFDVASRNNGKSLVAEALLATTELLATTSNNDHKIITTITRYMQFKSRPPGANLTWGRLNELLGDAYANLQQFDNAIDAYQSIHHFNPDHVSEGNIQLKLARCYYQLRQFSQVEKCVLKALRETSQDELVQIESHLYEILGNAYFSMGGYHKAAQAYEHALQNSISDQGSKTDIYNYLDFARMQIYG